MGQADPVEWLNGSDLNDAERAAVLGDTAAALLGL